MYTFIINLLHGLATYFINNVTRNIRIHPFFRFFYSLLDLPNNFTHPRNDKKGWEIL